MLNFLMDTLKIDKISDRYDVDFDEIINKIRSKGYKRVMIQLPEGLRMHALEIANLIEKNTGTEVFIWGGSNYGACDIPRGFERFRIDLLIHFGHARFYGNESNRNR